MLLSLYFEPGWKRVWLLTQGRKDECVGRTSNKSIGNSFVMLHVDL